jgi:carbonic anhydrase
MNHAPAAQLLKLLAPAVLLMSAAAARAADPAPAAPAVPATPPHWSYEGQTGPSHWGSEDPTYAACGMGKHQSPIDIENPKTMDLPAIQFAYQPVPLVVTDTGHTMQVNVPPGSGGITVGADHYDLLQFHFHRPSEERIRKQRYPLVVHLVHKSATGKLAVVAVLFRKGGENPLLKQVFENFPASGEKEKAVPGVMLDVAQLLPTAQGYYTFSGSLTTPPCSEDVRWFVMKRQMQATSGQIALFGTRYAADARPTQPTNGREIDQTRN